MLYVFFRMEFRFNFGSLFIYYVGCWFVGVFVGGFVFFYNSDIGWLYVLGVEWRCFEVVGWDWGCGCLEGGF